MNTQDMAQNSCVLNEIDREATKVRADAHLQNSLPGKDIMQKNHSDILNNLLGIIFSDFKAYLREIKFPVSKIFQFI